ncbi:MAG: MBOAT family O-acyltransferase [Winogradskyella sp.]
MLFNSIEFLIFLPIVFVLYWFVFNKSLKAQNILVLAASYLFYGWWDYRFLSLILLSTIVDYAIGISIYNSKKTNIKKWLLLLSVVFNLGVLGFFKYYNFFVDSWVELASAIGYEITSLWTLNIILPVGISFYTFQTMSYTIDIYRKNLEPTKNFISFASFVSFFPQLVAGPIERATHLLPQILKKREFNYQQSVDGLRLIIWGLFKKVVIADSLAPLVNDIFANYQDCSGATLWLGAIYFAFQIYCDFSGYSDIAIGISKLFGFELMSNFKFPYLSRNIGEFWRRWHISLSTWFRDYLYIPLGGSKKGKWLSFRNILIIFSVSGFWHGSNWTFIAWGFIHAMLYVPSFVFNTNRKYTSSIVAEHTLFPTIKEVFQIATTFFFVTIAWVFFRSDSITIALEYVKGMFLNFSTSSQYIEGLIYVFIIIVFDWINRKNERKYNRLLNYKAVIFIATLFILFKFNSINQFIYFQF